MKGVTADHEEFLVVCCYLKIVKNIFATFLVKSSFTSSRFTLTWKDVLKPSTAYWKFICPPADQKTVTMTASYDFFCFF